MLAEGDIVWTPSKERIDASRMHDFMAWAGARTGLTFEDYEGLWRWSVEDVEGFWAALWDYLDILHDGTPESVLSGEDMISSRWFEGARVNYAEHLLRHEPSAAADEIAIHHSSEIRPRGGLTWSELGSRVRALATQLRARGIKPGDRIVSYMPNIPETAIAMMATVAIGAIWSAASPEFGIKTVVDRFSQIEPKLLFAADGYTFGGKSFDRRAEIGAFVDQLPSIEQIVWLPYLGLDLPTDLSRPIVAWDALDWDTKIAREDFKFERVGSEHPLWILFSSGTTGLPKAIAHSHVGMILDHSKLMIIHFDLKPGETMFFYTTTGWMMWNAVLSSLISGASAVLYDGSPTWPDTGKLWSVAQDSGATVIGASPTIVSIMDQAGIYPNQRYDLSRLDKVVLGGAPATPATFEWLYAHTKPDMWVINTSGGTDLCGGLVGPVPINPVAAASFQGRSLGIAAEAWDDNGKALIGEVGELVVTRPFPSQPLFFWGDEGNVRYHDAYFSTYPGVWRHGDYFKLCADGTCYIYGRADATLNRYGVRIGTSEIYGVVSGIDQVADSVVVCCQSSDGEYFMPLFVQMNDGAVLDDALKARIKSALRQQASPRHVPDEIYQVPKVPYTLTGKKMEVPLRKIVMGAPVEKVATPEAMADPHAFDWFAVYAQGDDVRRRFKSTQA